ncbi:outer membrane beta-barrel protein [Tistrella mobilis]|jgi:opacity protein-like surface antigen|uniref:outer membrane protein n=1 Tax=Tistrella mobilis TaxID=171437 RepID=UPI003555D9EA
MTRKLTVAAMAVAFCALPAFAYAQDVASEIALRRGGEPGWYGSLLGGANMETDTSFTSGLAGGKIEQEFKTGFGVLGAVGYDFGRVAQWGGFRTELEIGYRQNNIDSHSVGGVDQPDSNGKSKVWSGMLNVYHDFYLPASRLTPYLGLGVGGAFVEADGYSADGSPTLLDDDDTVLAYQAMLGASYALSPSMSLIGEYRYFGTEGVELTTTAADGARSSSDSYGSHNVMVGLRVNF